MQQQIAQDSCFMTTIQAQEKLKKLLQDAHKKIITKQCSVIGKTKIWDKIIICMIEFFTTIVKLDINKVWLKVSEKFKTMS